MTKLMTLRGLAAGWAAWLSYYCIKSWLFSHFFQRLAFRLPLAFGHGLTQGLVWWVLRLCAWVACGWVVARLDRENAPKIVLVFAASVLLWKLQILPWTWHLAVIGMGNPRYRLELVAEVMSIILPPLFALAGGVLAARAQPQSNLQPA